MSDTAVPAPTPVPAAVEPAPVPPVAEVAAPVAPVEVPAPAVPEVAPEAAPAAPAARRKRAPKAQVSDETLQEYQAAIERDRRARERTQRAKVAQQSQAEAFRVLRQAVERFAAPAEAEDDDELARRVREAPARVRKVVAATLDMLGA